MDDLVISILLLCVYVVVVGGGYLYDIIKKQVKRHKKARKVVDEVNFEIEEENRLATLEQSKKEEQDASTQDQETKENEQQVENEKQTDDKE